MAAHIDERELVDREEAKKILKDKILVEGELIGLYEKTVGEVPNLLVQQMLKMIKHDSEKHIMMLNTVVDFLDGNEVFMEDRKGLAISLKRHVESEESIQRGERLLGHSWLRNRKGYKAIVEAWVEDEKRHHKLLKELSDRPFTPINLDDLFSAFRDEEFFEERYRKSKDFWERHKDDPRIQR